MQLSLDLFDNPSFGLRPNKLSRLKSRHKSCKILRILLFFSGSCSETEVSEQLYYLPAKPGANTNYVLVFILQKRRNKGKTLFALTGNSPFEEALAGNFIAQLCCAVFTKLRDKLLFTRTLPQRQLRKFCEPGSGKLETPLSLPATGYKNPGHRERE